MVLGGIPFYWEFLEKGLSVAQNIDRLFFEPDAQLKLEYDHLFSSLFRHPEGYVRIIHALAGKRTGLTRGEIAQKTKMSPSGNLTKKLKELESCGFIREYNGYGKKTKDSIFQLIDPFVLFYHHFLSSKPRDPAFWTHQLNTPAQNNWKGLAFEQICLLHVEQIKKTLGISMIHTDVFSFYCESNPDLGLFGSQIDMIIWRADRVINLLEMKYNTGLYLITKKQDQAMQNKMHDFITVTKTRDAVHLTLVTAYGVTPNIYSNGIQSQVTMKDLFQRV